MEFTQEMSLNRHRDEYKREFSEAMAQADLENLENSISDMSHENNLRRNVAIISLELAGERSLEPLIELVRKRDPERLATAIALLSTLYRRQKVVHPEFTKLLNGIIHSDLELHIRRSAADILGSLSCGRAEPEIHETFVDMLFWKDSLLREYALQYFQWSRSQSSVLLLGLLLKDDNPRIAELAKAALERMGRADALYTVKQAEKNR